MTQATTTSGSTTAKPNRRRSTTPRGNSTKNAKLNPVLITNDQRIQMIRDAAYYKAISRSFDNGSAEQDWLEAEQEIDRLIQGQSSSG